ncbi:hypothetical protein IMSAGC002_01604 [Lachnospiraceae bacterium]|nr:hypothetical protein IMSAGC002_01604 [Lachnospiraceae bacterium]
MKAPEKIEAVWDQDAHDNSILVLEKEEGKLSLAEVGNFLRYSHNGSFNGDYVIAICTKEGQEEAPQGDQWVLYKVEPGAGCPVCGNKLPFYEAAGKIDRKIGLIKRMQAEMDHRAEVEEKAVQLITEGRHGEAVELLNTLDDSVIARLQEEFETEEESPRQRAERRRQKAKVILNVLAEDVINMNWNQEEEYLKAFMKALKQIEEGGHE